MENSLQDQEFHQQQEVEFTCEICVEPVSTTRKFRNNNLCSHPFCIECIAKYIEVKILDNTAQIACPGLNCQQSLDPVSNMSLISKPLFSKWCDLLSEESVLNIDKSYCPNRECMMMVVNECGDSVKKANCPNCKQVFCFQCKKSWHAGFKCEESELMMSDRNDILLGMLIEKNKWQRCPVCRHCVQLRKGCKFVKCRCKTYFCYNCGKKTTDHKEDECLAVNPHPPRRELGVWEYLFFVALFFGLIIPLLFIIYGPKLFGFGEHKL
ncbi:hypothetical protein ACFE04_007061 [Oxalis oulophora]